jgi:cytochrome b pre-mRNA-processing protein 3
MQSMSSRRAAAHLYEAVVNAARDPVFYRDLSVPDTIEGRYEMIVLHIALALRAIRGPDSRTRRLAQAMVDTMAADLDRSIRELGVGDLSVARFMKRLGEGLYGRAAAYGTALDQDGDDALTSALLRNIYAGVDPGGDCLATLAAYVRRQDDFLNVQTPEQFSAGRLDFLSPNDCRVPC